MDTIKTFPIDLKQEFNSLKAANTCSICNKIFKDPLIIVTCNDVFCKECLDTSKNTCPTCLMPFTILDVEPDTFSEGVVASINELQKIFESGVEDTNNSFAKDIIPYVHLCTNTKRNSKGESPLHVACRRGQLAKVKELIRKNIDINFKDYAGWTPMHEAVLRGHYECVEALLEEGALIDVPGEDFSTPLHKASALGHVEIVKLLLRFGANMSVINYYGWTPLALAATDDVKNTFLIQHSEKFVVPKYFLPKITNVHYSLLSIEAITDLKNCSAIKIINAADFINREDCTHLVIGENEEMSLKILIGILKGVFIVDESWISKFIESKDHMLAFNHIAKTKKKVFQKSLLNNLKKLPRLFSGMNFYFVEYTKPYKIYDMEFSKKDFEKLVEIGGGKVLHRSPTPGTAEKIYHPYHINPDSELSVCGNYIIYMESQPSELLYNMKELRHKTDRWFIDCILSFSILT